MTTRKKTMRPTLSPQSRPAPRAAQTGFTLVEMMIVCAVIAILAAIAYPSYTGQMLKAQRAEGKAALMRAAQMLERSFTQEGAYPSGADALAAFYGAGTGTPVYSNPDNPLSATMGKFLVEYVPAAGAAPVEFLLRATPVASSITDTDCPTFGMDSRGRRLVSDAVPAASSGCWR